MIADSAFIASLDCIGYISCMSSYSTLAAITDLLEKAGQEILLPAFYASVQTSIKADGSVVTETDLKCQQLLACLLIQTANFLPNGSNFPFIEDCTGVKGDRLALSRIKCP